jgi:hypothetical protein
MSMDTPDAWETAGDVVFMLPDGRVICEKGRLAFVGLRQKAVALYPPIPGLRFNFGGQEHVTFADSINRDVINALYRSIAKAVCCMIGYRCKLIPVENSIANFGLSLISRGEEKALYGEDEHWVKTEEKIVASLKVSFTETDPNKNGDKNKRVRTG